MTETNLQNAIKDVLENKIFPQMAVFEDSEKMQVFLQDIPIPKEGEYDIDTSEYFPCCIVKIYQGEIESADDPQITRIEIIVGIIDEAEDMSGYQKLMATIGQIRDYFTAHVGIQNKFRMVYPLKWGINEDAVAPYFLGNVVTSWQLDRMPFADEGAQKYL